MISISGCNATSPRYLRAKRHDLFKEPLPRLPQTCLRRGAQATIWLLLRYPTNRSRSRAVSPARRRLVEPSSGSGTPIRDASSPRPGRATPRPPASAPRLSHPPLFAGPRPYLHRAAQHRKNSPNLSKAALPYPLPNVRSTALDIR